MRFLAITLMLLLVPSASAASGGGNAGDALTAFLRERTPWPEVRVAEVRLSAPAPSAPLLRITHEGPTLLGKTSFVFEFAGGKRINATAQVTAFDRVVISSRGLRKGSVLSGDDLYEALVDVTKIPRNALRSVDQAAGKTLSRSILPNTPLTESLIAASRTVRTGTRVALVLEAPGFAIRSAGRLRQQGTIGEHVKVQALSSDRIITGLLVDESTVKVEF